MGSGTDRLDWDRDGRDWPNRDHSRFVEAGGLKWHVQRMGQGPSMLLLHGTGASTHSWRDFAPLLAGSFDLLIPDLPGHGFTSAGRAGHLSLPGMSDALRDLLDTFDFAPRAVVGHSAGAAIAARMSIDGRISPDLIVSLNGALLPFGGVARHLFPSIAKLIAYNPFASRLAAWRARDVQAVRRLIEGTGSAVDARGLELYARLFATPSHVSATLEMMANWDLATLERDLRKLNGHVVIVAAGGDRAVPAEAAGKIHALIRDAQTVYVRNVGHLAHEERPADIAQIVLSAARRCNLAESDDATGKDTCA